MLIHRQALELHRMCADENDGKHALTAIKVEPTGHVTVCDGTQYLRIAAKVEEPGLFDALVPEEERVQTQTILLPAEAAESFNAALKKRKKKKDEVPPSVVISQDEDGHIRLASSDGRTMRRFEIEPPTQPYPEIERVLRGHVVTKEVLFGVDLLLDVLKTFKATGCSTIRFGFAEGQDAPVKVTAFSEIGPIEGAVMPRRE
jgi:hypothetical protein